MFESSHYLQTMYNQPNIESLYQNDSLMRFHCMPWSTTAYGLNFYANPPAASTLLLCFQNCSKIEIEQLCIIDCTGTTNLSTSFGNPD